MEVALLVLLVAIMELVHQMESFAYVVPTMSGMPLWQVELVFAISQKRFWPQVNALYALLAQLEVTVKVGATAHLLTPGLLLVQLDHANYVTHCQTLFCLLMGNALLVVQLIHLLWQVRQTNRIKHAPALQG